MVQLKKKKTFQFIKAVQLETHLIKVKKHVLLHDLALQFLELSSALYLYHCLLEKKPRTHPLKQGY